MIRIKLFTFVKLIVLPLLKVVFSAHVLTKLTVTVAIMGVFLMTLQLKLGNVHAVLPF